VWCREFAQNLQDTPDFEPDPVMILDAPTTRNAETAAPYLRSDAPLMRAPTLLGYPVPTADPASCRPPPDFVDARRRGYVPLLEALGETHHIRRDHTQ
jgi:hypothetical protein